MHTFRNPCFRWLLTVVLLTVTGYQFWTRSDGFITLSRLGLEHAGWIVFLVGLLMPVNWMLEGMKWQVFLSVHARVSFLKILKSIACGIAFSLFTPNRIGEYGGRLLFMPYAIRWPVAISTMMGSVSQNLIALIAGIFSLTVLLNANLFITILGAFSIIICTICYFRLKWLVHFICGLRLHPVMKKLARQLNHIEDYSARDLWKGLAISSLRYAVYCSQFVLLLIAFEPEASLVPLFIGVSALYLFHTLLPLPPVADVLARMNVALIVWGGTGMSELSISLASFIVWLINLFVPAIIGSVMAGTMRPGKSFNTHDQHLSPAYKPVIADQTVGAGTS